ncbi:diguanylate cyclase [Xanthobacter tagetidis]|nr:diguanylate cyclase [Xanthobacter tagetidis]MBB6310012.1 diguanylate cyclase (GGDEF)-like protein [Xanthobacter tagetidis]
MSSVLIEALNAETGQRGYLVTSNKSYLAPYFRAVAVLNDSVRDLHRRLPAVGPQADLMKQLIPLVEHKLEEMSETLAIEARDGPEAARTFVANGAGKNHMDAIRATLDSISFNEALALRDLQRAYQGHKWWAIADMLGFVITFLALIAAFILMARRAEVARQEAEADHARYAAEIAEKANQLRAERNEVSEINEMASFLQSCGSLQELGDMIGGFLSRSFPGGAGGLYTFSASRNKLLLLGGFGDVAQSLSVEPDACWGLRRGGPHSYTPDGGRPRCQHFGDERVTHTLCHPLIAHGETMGLFVLESAEPLPASFDRLAFVASQHLALAVGNLRLRDTLKEQSIRDPLTGVFNRRYFDSMAEKERARNEQLGPSFAVIMIDVDHFKRYNDLHGHAAGDQVLVAFCGYLLAHIRGNDTLFRIGGEEFALVLREVDLDGAILKAERLREGVAALRIEENGNSLPSITVSMGIAVPGSEVETFEDVLARADQQLYKAKLAGRNRIVADIPLPGADAAFSPPPLDEVADP